MTEQPACDLRFRPPVIVTLVAPQPAIASRAAALPETALYGPVKALLEGQGDELLPERGAASRRLASFGQGL